MQETLKSWYNITYSVLEGSYFLSRSPDQSRPDESGISSEESCLTLPMYNQLTDMASLLNQLQTTLEGEGGGRSGAGRNQWKGSGGESEGEEGGSRGGGGGGVGGASFVRLSQTPSPELVVLGPPGTRPQAGKTLARYDPSRSVVYSRSSSQLLPSGATPNTATVVVKDSCAKLRQAEVVVDLPNEASGNRRWTRAGTRVMDGTHHLPVSYLEESYSSSDLSSSSDGESRAVMEIERRKKRLRRRPQPKSSKSVSKAKGKSAVVLRRDLVSSGEEEEEEEGDGVTSQESQERGAVEEDGGVQMECEVGGEELGSPIPPLVLPSPQQQHQTSFQQNTQSAFSFPANVSAVYEDLDLDRTVASAQEGGSDSGCGGGGDGGVRRGVGVPYAKSVRPCSVTITSLPRHVVHRYLLPRANEKPPSTTAMESAAASAHLHRKGPRSSSSDSSSLSRSSSGSDSESMLVSQQQYSVVESVTPLPDNDDSSPDENGKTTSSRNSRPGVAVKSTTPRRVKGGGSGGSKLSPPTARRSFPFSKPPSTPSASQTIPSTTTTPLSAKSTPKFRLALIRPLGNSPRLSLTTPTSGYLTTPTTTPLTTPTRATRDTPAAGRTSSVVGGRKTLSHSFARKSTGGDRTLAIEWSSDEDFTRDPTPSLVVSPTPETPVPPRNTFTISLPDVSGGKEAVSGGSKSSPHVSSTPPPRGAVSSGGVSPDPRAVSQR